MSTPPSASSPLPGEQPGFFAALRYRDFRLLWLGMIVSLTGSQMRIVAVSFQIYELTRLRDDIPPELALGLIGLVRALALILTAPVSGLVADRSDRRRMLIFTSLAALSCSVVLALIGDQPDAPLWLIYAMVGGAGVAAAFELPARQALVPRLVPAAQLPNALSLNILAFQLATVIGPTIAGILIAQVGLGPVYWIDAFSFLAVVTAATLMQRHPVPASQQAVTFGAALEGLRFVFRNRLIASTMLLDFFATFFGAATTLLPVFADQVLDVGPIELGWMYAAPSVGAVLAALLLSSMRLRRQGHILLWAVVVFGICTAIFGLSTYLPLTLLALAGTGAADTVSAVIRSTIRQLQTPDELRGRMTAVNMVFFAGGPQLGELESGIMATLIGAPYAVLIGGVLTVVLSAGVAARVPELRRYE